MGVKAWFIACWDEDSKPGLPSSLRLDRERTKALVSRAYPDRKLVPGDDAPLACLNPDVERVFAASFPSVDFIAAHELANDYPSKIDARWLALTGRRVVYLHATHSAVDWFAYAVWEQGKLQRALSVSPDSGFLEDVGAPLAFETPYRDGAHPVDTFDDEDAYPLPFHPLELAEASLLHHLGFQFEGRPEDWWIEPFERSIMTFSLAGTGAENERSDDSKASARPWWKPW